MAKQRDHIFDEPRPMIVDFTFDERVASVFPDMIRRSVPGYGEVIALTGLFAERYAQPGSTLYDLGCSLGAATLSMRRRVHADQCRIIAVDNAPAMVEQCRANLEAEPSPVPVDVHCSDIRKVHIENASVVVLNFTLQFIEPDERLELLHRIHQGLRPGGVLVLSEKVVFENEREQQFQESMHLDFKRANGYSELAISQKRTALENVLLPESLEAHTSRLRNAGFGDVHNWFRCFNFASMAAFKTP
ncbi:carboxy-S-adenosyl-L-methionine synthase CmoA [Thiohalomonas denitrificans]|uniref:Carboxy-S-adenosyl-L-methionine synthase n=1 Tax=Thiohalomonas denitrificans TaxID=415747 RepID=A0A1G5PHZ5_9GAMM|nr:carboxy-S-adenosyl-L-methionine synthase CmoA [Thiohalomonas denitrificans]SCZ49066.1 tRNA (cmo5U34)-methyltransferase [Thiohalomonas denitrificans]